MTSAKWNVMQKKKRFFPPFKLSGGNIDPSALRGEPGEPKRTQRERIHFKCSHVEGNTECYVFSALTMWVTHLGFADVFFGVFDLHLQI